LHDRRATWRRSGQHRQARGRRGRHPAPRRTELRSQWQTNLGTHVAGPTFVGGEGASGRPEWQPEGASYRPGRAGHRNRVGRGRPCHAGIQGAASRGFARTGKRGQPLEAAARALIRSPGAVFIYEGSRFLDFAGPKNCVPSVAGHFWNTTTGEQDSPRSTGPRGQPFGPGRWPFRVRRVAEGEHRHRFFRPATNARGDAQGGWFSREFAAAGGGKGRDYVHRRPGGGRAASRGARARGGGRRGRPAARGGRVDILVQQPPAIFPGQTPTLWQNRPGGEDVRVSTAVSPVETSKVSFFLTQGAWAPAMIPRRRRSQSSKTSAFMGSRGLGGLPVVRLYSSTKGARW